MGRHAFGLDVDGLLAARDAASRAYASEQEEIAAEWFVELYAGGPGAVGTYNGIYSTCRKVPPDEVV